MKESNLKLHAVMEEMLAKIESKNGELASLRDKLESAAADLEKREMESGTQIGQLKKLVDHLQSKVDSSTEKKHHGKGGKQHSQPQLEWAMSYEEMQESAETIPQKWES